MVINGGAGRRRSNGEPLYKHVYEVDREDLGISDVNERIVSKSEVKKAIFKNKCQVPMKVV